MLPSRWRRALGVRGDASVELLPGVAPIASGGGRRSPPTRLVMVDAAPDEASAPSRGVSPSTERTLSGAAAGCSSPRAAPPSTARPRDATRPRIWFLWQTSYLEVLPLPLIISAQRAPNDICIK